MKKFKPVIALLFLGLLLGAWVALDAGRYLSLGYLQQSHAEFARLYALHPASVLGAYLALYVLVCALSLPGATLLTLAGGAVFGLWWGTLVVSFASSLGATLAFLVARHVLRDSLEARFGTRLAEFNQGVARQGALYLFTLRLVPLVPFFIVNLGMGLTRMRTRTFYGVSQLGMLAGTLVYVNAGTQLGRLTSLQDILSPALLGSFVLLASFPWLARQGLGWVQQRRLYARWQAQKPRRFDRNLIVIGAGAGGLVSAYIAAAVKARVTLVEMGAMGGDCLNYGCVPSKALIKSARLAHQMRHGARYGLSNTEPVFPFKNVMQRVQATIAAIAPHDSVARYTGLGVEVLQGHARLINPWTVEITAPAAAGQNAPVVQRLSSRAIVLATGARPLLPPFLKDAQAQGFNVLTSDTLWQYLGQLETTPQHLLVLGGGPIGCELAQSLARLGAQVTVLEQAPRLLLREDEDVSALVQDALQQDGVRVLTGHTALQCERDADGHPQLVVQHQGQTLQLGFETLLCALGREARLTGLGLEELGIPSERTVTTNAYLETLYPNIYAAGDVAGPEQFTHVAAHQAWYATVNALFGGVKKFKVDTRVLPRTTFTDPEVARVGLNETQARAQQVAFEVSRFELAELDRAIADSDTQGFVKVLTRPGSDQILGVTLVGRHAGDLLAEYVLAMKHGLGLNKILGTVHSYPTLAEANKYAAGVWKRAHQPERLLRWARRYHDWRRG